MCFYTFFTQTELCQSSLQQYMEEQPVDPLIMGWPLFIDILTGLDHIHEQGFIHLDIKVFLKIFKNFKQSKMTRKTNFELS